MACILRKLTLLFVSKYLSLFLFFWNGEFMSYCVCLSLCPPPPRAGPFLSVLLFELVSVCLVVENPSLLHMRSLTKQRKSVWPDFCHFSVGVG